MQEKEKKVASGAGMFVFTILFFILSVVLFVIGVRGSLILGLAGGLGFIIWIFLLPGFFVLQPNEAAAIILFGSYLGTVKNSGWHWTNPFATKKKVSLRTRTMNGEKLKVNDEMGNPIEIAAVVVWKVDNTAQALFDVENYLDYVQTQSETAVRHLARMYPYDITDDGNQISLRGSADEVSDALRIELQERLGQAGVVVQEARLSHLAYAPEIAAAMLQRQQAAAIIAARQKIVEGAVGMVQMALTKLNENGIVDLDEERKATMVSNLLVVLCGERAAQPVVNAGSLYT